MTDPDPQVLSVQDVDITYYSGKVAFPAIRKVSFAISAGQAFGLAGESGSGKSTLAYAVMQYLAGNGEVSNGTISFGGTNLMTMSSTELLGLRGLKISMVPQDPLTSLNPSHRVGDQVSEILRIHCSLTRQEAHEKAVRMLEQVHLPVPELTALKYPHQISVIAMAFCTNPELLIMDEPTTGLDVTTQARILDLIGEMKTTHKTAILYITHDLGVVKNLCDRVAIIYAGEIVEEGDVSLPNLSELKPACIFSPRCRFAEEQCRRQVPLLMDIGNDRRIKCFFEKLPDNGKKEGTDERRTNVSDKDILIKVKNLKKVFPTRKGDLRAVDDTSFECRKGEILGIVGESGCGKTTMARCIVGLEEKSGGSISFSDKELDTIRKRSKDMRRKIQMVFQNSEATLNPQKTVEEIITRPLALYNVVPKSQLYQRAVELLESVNLGEQYLTRYPHEISGGEKQRVGIARAFATEPELIVLDEPISSLDVSVQAGILNLLLDLQKKHNIAYIFIGHNLSVIRRLCNRVMVLYMGRICEIGTPGQLFDPPYHPYTEALLSAIPVVEPDIGQREVRLGGAMPSAIDPIPGCAFHIRCPRKIGDVCVQNALPDIEVGPGHKITCHLSLDELSAVSPIFK